MKITKEMLDEKYCTTFHFEKVFPNGVNVTRRSIRKAFVSKLDVECFAEKFFNPPALAQYLKSQKMLLAQYRKIQKPDWAQYMVDLEPAFVEGCKIMGWLK